MMTVLIVGGDYVGSFKQLIASKRNVQVEHWNGRKKGYGKRALPNETKLVVLVCDYVSHSLAHAVKEKANRNKIPLLYCHRSVNELRHKLIQNEELADATGSCPCACCTPKPIRRLH